MRENQPKTNTPELFTDRLHLRKFTADDTEAVFRIYSDREVNTFLPWFPVKDMEAAKAVLAQMKRDGMTYATATHDEKNPASGRVMEKIGMKYRYSYREQWQPKNIPVIFRMYQINLDGRDDRVYRAYWERYPEHFISERI
mgnify:FL=1